MKKLLILALTTIISTNTFAIDIATNSLAYTLAQTIYSAAVGVASSEVSSLATSADNMKAEAYKIQNEAQNYYQSGIASVYLENKIKMAKNLDSSLSEEESVDLIVEASQIILKL